MNQGYVFAVAGGIGVVAGLRTLMAPAAIAWAVRLGWINLHGSPFAFMESRFAVPIFSLLAIGELIADLLPTIPRRTAIAPLLARILSGGFCGACVCASAGQSLALGAAAGATGAVIGAFAGYETRRYLVKKRNIRDHFVALGEDAVAITLAWFFLSR
jgi:uncharacterized membrane protein